MSDDLRRALHVPRIEPEDPAQRRAVLSWLQNRLGEERVDSGSLSGPGTVTDRPCLDLVQLASFWEEEGRTSLTDRMGTWLASLTAVGAEWTIAVERDSPRFRWSVAVADGSPIPAHLEDALPGAEVATGPPLRGPLQTSLMTGDAAALLGVPTRRLAPRATPLLERLSTTSATRWLLVINGQPVDASHLEARHGELATLQAQFAARTRLEHAVSEVISRPETDPVAELVSELLRRETRRSARMLQVGATATEAWLLASADDLGALTGIAMAELSGDHGAVAHPIRAMPTGGQRPARTLLLPEEIATIVQPPVHDVPGFRVGRWVRFDVEPEPVDRLAGPTIRLGAIRGGGTLDHPVDALVDHTLVAGATGSGKSTLLRSMLGRLEELDVPFLVIEPTKDEYASVGAADLDVWRMGGPAGDRALNPLEVPPGLPVQTHIDLLVALLGSTFGLFPPLPYLVEVALRRVYQDRGWDLATGRNAQLDVDPEHPAMPTLRELLASSLRLVDELGYQGEVRHNVRAALHARLGSLLEGGKGELLDTDRPLDAARLLGGRCVVNLDLVGNDGEKAFLMGLLLIRLWAARRGQHRRRLQHVTVLEEAHRILSAPRPTHELGSPASNFASETFGNLLAEVRAAGEALVVVDQSPSSLAAPALANTNLKIALRTMHDPDREVLAASCNLEENEQRILTSLEPHDALVFRAGMDRPIRIRTATAPIPERGPTVGKRATAAPPVMTDPFVDRLADLLVRAERDEVGAVRDELASRVRELLPSPLEDRQEAVIERAVASAADRLGRSRQLPHSERRAIVEGALASDPPGTRLQTPRDVCRCYGPPAQSRCPFDEPVQAAVDRWRQEGGSPADAVDLTPPEALVAHLRARVADAFGTSVPARAVERAARCLAARAMVGSRPSGEVRARIGELPWIGL